MPLTPGLALTLALAVLALVGMVWGWRRRSRRDGTVSVPRLPVAGTQTATFTGLHVATTRHDAPLDRLAVKPFDFRARGTFTVTTAGLVLDLAGSEAVFLPADRLTGAGHATWTIDRVVERDGLVLIGWTTDDGTECDTYLRVERADPDGLIDAIENLKTTPSAPSEATR